MPDLRNAKEHYESFLQKNNRKSIKQSGIIIYQPKTFQNLNIVEINSDIIEHSKTSHKLSKSIRKSEKIDSNNSFYCDAIKVQLV